MIIRRANPSDVDGICATCAAGWRDTYAGLYPPQQIEQVIAKYYTPSRVLTEIAPRPDWDGWYVAADESGVVGAGGGGIPSSGKCELYVLYVQPAKRYHGIGTALLDEITREMIFQGAVEQFVAVDTRNAKGLPFYRARGFTDYGRRGGSAGYSDSFLLRRSITAETHARRFTPGVAYA